MSRAAIGLPLAIHRLVPIQFGGEHGRVFFPRLAALQLHRVGRGIIDAPAASTPPPDSRLPAALAYSTPQNRPAVRWDRRNVPPAPAFPLQCAACIRKLPTLPAAGSSRETNGCVTVCPPKSMRFCFIRRIWSQVSIVSSVSGADSQPRHDFVNQRRRSVSGNSLHQRDDLVLGLQALGFGAHPDPPRDGRSRDR